MTIKTCLGGAVSKEVLAYVPTKIVGGEEVRTWGGHW